MITIGAETLSTLNVLAGVAGEAVEAVADSLVLLQCKLEEASQ